MKILTIEFPVDKSIIQSGEEWEEARDTWCDGNVLYGETESGVYDYDLFIADAESISDDAASLESIQAEITRRVNSGAILICFASREGMAWIPSSAKPYSTGGSIMEVVPGTPFASVLARYQNQTEYRTLLRLSKDCQVLENNNAGVPVAAWQPFGQGHIIVLPWFAQPGKVIRSLLDRVLPKLAPQLFREEEELPEEERPEWLSDFPVPGVSEVATDIEGIDEELRKLEELREQKDTERQEKAKERKELEGLQLLLWGSGKPLERVARRALNLLGIKAYPGEDVGPAVDLVIDLDDGKLFIEIEGPEGPINVDKGRQLLGYIDDAEESDKVDGAILGNPYRLEHPDARPPKGSQTGLFTEPLKRMARNHSWHLVETRDLFRLVTCYLETKDESAGDDMRKLLGL